jgi:hypothetical protein
MRKLGFWANDEHRQIEAINEAADELGRLQSNATFAHQQSTALRLTVERQQAEIERLKGALQAVCDLLVDLDLIEEEALAYRVEAAIEVAAAPAPVSPYDPPTSAPPAAKAVECSRCKRQVKPADIAFTDRGPMCDPCIGALAAETFE